MISIFDNFYSTDFKTWKLFYGLVVGFGPKGKEWLVRCATLFIKSWVILSIWLDSEEFIQIYFCLGNGETVSNKEIEANRKIKERVPFAVVGSNCLIDGADGKKIRGRKYPWGIVDVSILFYNPPTFFASYFFYRVTWIKKSQLEKIQTEVNSFLVKISLQNVDIESLSFLSFQ